MTYIWMLLRSRGRKQNKLYYSMTKSYYEFTWRNNCVRISCVRNNMSVSKESWWSVTGVSRDTEIDLWTTLARRHPGQLFHMSRDQNSFSGGYKHQAPNGLQIIPLNIRIFFWFFLVGLVLNSGFWACKTGTLPLEPYSSPFFSGYLRDRGLITCLSRLALNHDPLDLSLPSS
jgi:hypothetical protein